MSSTCTLLPPKEPSSLPIYEADIQNAIDNPNAFPQALSAPYQMKDLSSSELLRTYAYRKDLSAFGFVNYLPKFIADSQDDVLNTIEGSRKSFLSPFPVSENFEHDASAASPYTLINDLPINITDLSSSAYEDYLSYILSTQLPLLPLPSTPADNTNNASAYAPTSDEATPMTVIHKELVYDINGSHDTYETFFNDITPIKHPLRIAIPYGSHNPLYRDGRTSYCSCYGLSNKTYFNVLETFIKTDRQKIVDILFKQNISIFLLQSDTLRFRYSLIPDTITIKNVDIIHAICLQDDSSSLPALNEQTRNTMPPLIIPSTTNVRTTSNSRAANKHLFHVSFTGLMVSNSNHEDARGGTDEGTQIATRVTDHVLLDFTEEYEYFCFNRPLSKRPYSRALQALGPVDPKDFRLDFPLDLEKFNEMLVYTLFNASTVYFDYSDIQLIRDPAKDERIPQSFIKRDIVTSLPSTVIGFSWDNGHADLKDYTRTKRSQCGFIESTKYRLGTDTGPGGDTQVPLGTLDYSEAKALWCHRLVFHFKGADEAYVSNVFIPCFILLYVNAISPHGTIRAYNKVPEDYPIQADRPPILDDQTEDRIAIESDELANATRTNDDTYLRERVTKNYRYVNPANDINFRWMYYFDERIDGDTVYKLFNRAACLVSPVEPSASFSPYQETLHFAPETPVISLGDIHNKSGLTFKDPYHVIDPMALGLYHPGFRYPEGTHNLFQISLWQHQMQFAFTKEVSLIPKKRIANTVDSPSDRNYSIGIPQGFWEDNVGRCVYDEDKDLEYYRSGNKENTLIRISNGHLTQLRSIALEGKYSKTATDAKRYAEKYKELLKKIIKGNYQAHSTGYQQLLPNILTSISVNKGFVSELTVPSSIGKVLEEIHKPTSYDLKALSQTPGCVPPTEHDLSSYVNVAPVLRHLNQYL